MAVATKLEKNKSNHKEEPNGKENVSVADNSQQRFGPLPKFPHQKVWSRCILILGLFVYVWFNSKSATITYLARQKDVLEKRGQQFKCDKVYLDEIQVFPRCIPTKCGRFVSDSIITNEEMNVLLQLAKEGIGLRGSSGGASILDIGTGALSHKKLFVDFYSLPEAKDVLTREHMLVYNNVKAKIRHAIARNFNIEESWLHLTSPTFFSKLTNDSPRTENDIYWNIHVDKETYEFFHFTTLLYLSDYEIDFDGGRLIFLDNFSEKWKRNNVTMEPRKGRVVMFTSGAENTHYVERVTRGTRYALTIAFTCDPTKAINPSLKFENK